MIRALLYRLLIISAHLQRHGIRLLIAIGRFNARAAAFGADPPAPFDSTNLSTLLFLLLVAPLSLPSFLLLLFFSFFTLFPLDFFSTIVSSLFRSSFETHYNYLRRRPRGNVFPIEFAKRDDEKFREVREPA